MGLMNLLLKHRFGDLGLVSMVEISAVFSASIGITYNVAFPSTRSVYGFNESFTFNVIVFFISLIFSVMVLKNVAFGIAQDIFDSTIITFMQMRGRKRLFLYIYFIDILLQLIIFIIVAELIFVLGSFNFGAFWILEFSSTYLALGSIYFLIALLSKRPYRTFFISVFVIFLFMGLYVINLVNYYLFALITLIFTLVDYKLFQRLSL